MPRDGENLFRRKGERFWYFKYKGLDGKWHEQSTGKAKKSDARDFRNEEMARYKAGQTPNDMKRWTLQQAVDYQLEILEAKKSKSVRLIRTSLNAVIRVFGPDKRLDQITDLDLDRYQVHRLKMKKLKGDGPISANTVNLEILYLSHVMKKAKLWDKISGTYKRLPKNKRAIGRAITMEQFIELVKTARENPAWEVALCASVLAASSGGQRGIEIKNLRLGNINITADEAWIVIPRDATKTDAGCREIPLNGLARWAAERLIERATLAGASEPHHYLLPKDRTKHTRPDDPMKGKMKGYDPTDHQSSWHQSWNALCSKAGLPGLRFHDMRHLFITQAAEAGVPLLVTESLVGHMSAEMIRHYTHIREGAKKKAAADIEKQYEPVMQLLMEHM